MYGNLTSRRASRASRPKQLVGTARTSRLLDPWNPRCWLKHVALLSRTEATHQSKLSALDDEVDEMIADAIEVDLLMC